MKKVFPYSMRLLLRTGTLRFLRYAPHLMGKNVIHGLNRYNNDSHDILFIVWEIFIIFVLCLHIISRSTQGTIKGCGSMITINKVRHNFRFSCQILVNETPEEVALFHNILIMSFFFQFFQHFLQRSVWPVVGTYKVHERLTI